MNKFFYTLLVTGFVFTYILDCAGSPKQQKIASVTLVTESDTSTLLCNHIIKLIEEDSIIELSTYVRYPLKRPYPVPDIQTPEAFILYYPILFDSTLRAMLKGFVFNEEANSFQGKYWLPGDIKIDEYYKNIWDVGYNPPAEKELQKRLDKEIRNTIYRNLKNYDKNFVVGETEKYKFRIDYVGDSMRFACWHTGQSISDKPDVIVPNAKPQVGYRGSGPWWDYSFKDGDWTYVVEFGGHDGLTFDILFKEQKKYFAPFKEIK